MELSKITKFSAPLLEAWYETPDVRVLRVDARQSFKPGQFYMVGFEGTNTKAMSVCSSPTKPYLDFGAKLTGSEHKKKWSSIQPGEPVILQGPYGLFTLQEQEKRICMIAGGIGITPFLSYLQYALDKQLENDFVLLYSNKTLADRAFSKQFEQMQQDTANSSGPTKVKFVETLTREPEGNGWNGLRGRINKETFLQHVPDAHERLHYICGVPDMVRDMAATLEQLGVEKKRVKKEEFTGLH